MKTAGITVKNLLNIKDGLMNLAVEELYGMDLEDEDIFEYFEWKEKK